MKEMKKNFIPALLLGLFLASCGGTTSDETDEVPTSMLAAEVSTDPMKNKGIGPISSITLADEVDAEMADAGRVLFEQMCTACHKPDRNFVGPAPKDVLTRRTPEWIMNMMLNPEEMTQKDPIAKELLLEFNGMPMTNQPLSEEQARQMLEYFRTL